MLITINLVLFAAAFLAVWFSLVSDPISGAILGMAIWSAYFLLLTWVSSNAATSVVSFILGSATAGLKQIFALLGNLFSGTASDDVPLTEEAASALIRQEVQTALNTANVQSLVEGYLQTAPRPKVDVVLIQQELDCLLEGLDVESLAEAGLLQQVDRQTFHDLIHTQTNLSESEAAVVVEQLETAWQNILDRHPQRDLNQTLITLLQSTPVDQLTVPSLLAQLDTLLNDVPAPDRSQGIKQWLTQQPIDFAKLKRTLLQRLDLSELDVNRIWQQLRSLGNWTADGSKSEFPTNTIWLDVEDYLLHAYPWELEEPEHSPFREVLYDPNAAPDQVRSQLETFGLEQFTSVLQQRPDLTTTQAREIAQRLERDRLEVLETVRSAERQEQVDSLLQQIEHYLKTTDKALLESTDLEAELQH
ncbi:MAG: hypothetical protein HC881_23750 [Leptolyngbyaceae cyanobacterium SL_7_1]|nr:hypothetical protein [Leptolyngbyaceae cyanobacterium SL_7_1]